MFTPSFTAPVEDMMDTTYGHAQEDQDLFAYNYGDWLTITSNNIASMIATRLVRDLDPTTLETAREYIKKAKAFIGPVSKFVRPNDKVSKNVIDGIMMVFSSLEEMIDGKVAARDMLYDEKA